MKRPSPRGANARPKDKRAARKAEDRNSSEEIVDPFVCFTEWAGEADEKAYASLR